MNVNKPIIVKQTFNVPLEIVWKAITDLDQMKQWFFDNIENFKPEVGFKTRFTVKTENRNFLHLWHIVEVDPMKKIVYNWKYDGYEGESFVHFELYELNNITTLQVTSVVVEVFPSTIPEFESESCRQGWNYFIKNSLKNFIENN